MKVPAWFHLKLRDVIDHQDDRDAEALKRLENSFTHVYRNFESNPDFYLSNKEIRAHIPCILEHDGLLIRLVKNSTEEERLTAVKQNGLAIKYIIDPSLEVQKEAVKNNGEAIIYIEEPSLEVQKLALKWFNEQPKVI